MPWAVVRDIIRQDLGRPIEEVFSSIDERPLASASIAQVGVVGEGLSLICCNKLRRPPTLAATGTDSCAPFI